jgi:hypothetical protein
MLCSGEKNFWGFHTYMYMYIGMESVLKADFGPKGWDWTGRRLDIWGEFWARKQNDDLNQDSEGWELCPGNSYEKEPASSINEFLSQH